MIGQVGLPRSYLQLPQVGQSYAIPPPMTLPLAVPPQPVILTGPPFPPLAAGSFYLVDTQLTTASLVLPALAFGGIVWVADGNWNASKQPITINGLQNDQIALYGNPLQPFVTINVNDGMLCFVAYPGRWWRALPPVVM